MLVFSATAFAYSNPRWFNMPISVYVPKTTQGATASNAFKAWQSASSGVTRFQYRSSTNMANLCDIIVEFSDSWPSDDKPYKITQLYTMFDRDSITSNRGFYYKQVLTVALKDKAGSQYTDKELYSIVLNAVGESLGIPAGNFDMAKQSVTDEDVEALKKVYRK